MDTTQATMEAKAKAKNDEEEALAKNDDEAKAKAKAKDDDEEEAKAEDEATSETSEDDDSCTMGDVEGMIEEAKEKIIKVTKAYVREQMKDGIEAMVKEAMGSEESKLLVLKMVNASLPVKRKRDGELGEKKKLKSMGKKASVSVEDEEEEGDEMSATESSSSSLQTTGVDVSELVKGGIICFGADSKKEYSELSNQCALQVPITLSLPVGNNDEEVKLRFPSVEHAYQATKSDTPEMFAIGGILTDADKAFTLVFGEKQGAKKRETWYVKRGMIGAVAYKASAVTRIAGGPCVKSFGKDENMITVRFKSKEDRTTDPKEVHDLFIDILASKFKRNKNARKVLLATGDAYLIEESRLAKNEPTTGR